MVYHFLPQFTNDLAVTDPERPRFSGDLLLRYPGRVPNSCLQVRFGLGVHTYIQVGPSVQKRILAIVLVPFDMLTFPFQWSPCIPGPNCRDEVEMWSRR